MKLTKFLMTILVMVPFLGACTQADITDLSDPRDAICKKYRVVDNEGFEWDSELIKGPDDKQTIYIWNLHGLDGDGSTGAVPTSEMFAGILAAGSSQSVLTLNNMTIFKNGEDKTIISGSATIYADNIESFTLSYTLKEGADPAKSYTADFGPHSVNPVKKNKKRTLTFTLLQ